MGDNITGEWTTHREIEWLGGLKCNDLLRKYLETMHKRDDWGGIDPEYVEAWIKERLNGT